MKPNSRTIIHLGINLVITPFPVINQITSLAFQNAIIAHGLEYQNAINEQNKLILIRGKPYPLEITVGALNLPNTGQLIIVAPLPNRPVNVFIQEAEAVAEAFLSTWNYQFLIIGSDTAIRELHETSEEHAFQEIWEKRLKQPGDALSAFERPIRGGGLRFILDPKVGDPNPIRIEVKIESFIDNTKKIFIETLFFYFQPPQGSEFNITQRIKETDQYVTNQVYNFFKGENK